MHIRFAYPDDASQLAVLNQKFNESLVSADQIGIPGKLSDEREDCCSGD